MRPLLFQPPQPAPGAARRAAPTRAPINRSLERQAEDATRLALRGDVNASRILTPAPAAGVQLSDSPAEALPPPIRQRAEVAFGADLSAVRVHRDASASSAAASYGAAAFTAGNHIFFGERQWSPSSGTGMALLYHELAHVLQQTGRRESETLIRAQDRHGSAAVQAFRRGGRRG